MDATTQYLKACADAWLNCDNLLITLHEQSTSYSGKTTKVVDECAHICLGMMHALKHKWANMAEVALLCVGICEECAELCERYEEEQFIRCAAACRKCSAIFTKLIAPVA